MRVLTRPLSLWRVVPLLRQRQWSSEPGGPPRTPPGSSLPDRAGHFTCPPCRRVVSTEEDPGWLIHRRWQCGSGNEFARSPRQP